MLPPETGAISPSRPGRSCAGYLESEVILGSVLREFPRDETVVSTKITSPFSSSAGGRERSGSSSEQTRSDGSHEWLKKILPAGVVDVAMVGHNMINQSAEKTIFPLCIENDSAF